MKKEEKSAAEIMLKELWEELLTYPFIAVRDFQKFVLRLSKLLTKCEELRKQRNTWRAKYEKLKEELK